MKRCGCQVDCDCDSAGWSLAKRRVMATVDSLISAERRGELSGDECWGLAVGAVRRYVAAPSGQ